MNQSNNNISAEELRLECLKCATEITCKDNFGTVPGKSHKQTIEMANDMYNWARTGIISTSEKKEV